MMPMVANTETFIMATLAPVAANNNNVTTAKIEKAQKEITAELKRHYEHYEKIIAEFKNGK